MLCALIECEKFVIFTISNDSSLPLNDFTYYQHINSFHYKNFPLEYLLKFFSVAKNFLSDTKDLIEQDIEDNDNKYIGILLTIKVKSCNTKTIAGNYHESPFSLFVSIYSYNTQLVIRNININLNNQESIKDATSYFSKLIINY